jgi:hypothetical protein
VTQSPVVSQREMAPHPPADEPPPPRADGYAPASANWPLYRLKRLVLGPPLATKRLIHERLGKVVALAVLASDNISSSAYGTEQVMLPCWSPGRPRSRSPSRSRLASSSCSPS